MLSTIKVKFIIIYFLNVSDIFLTLILLQTGYFIEGNFFMRSIVENKALSFAAKVVIPLMLLYIIYKRIEAATERQLNVGNVLINGCLIFYTLVNLSHIIWISWFF